MDCRRLIARQISLVKWRLCCTGWWVWHTWWADTALRCSLGVTLVWLQHEGGASKLHLQHPSQVQCPWAGQGWVSWYSYSQGGSVSKSLLPGLSSSTQHSSLTSCFLIWLFKKKTYFNNSFFFLKFSNLLKYYKSYSIWGSVKGLPRYCYWGNSFSRKWCWISLP